MHKCKLWALAAVVLASVLAGAGCVERKLTINTTPSGAVVTLNDEQIGVSPATVSFNWYGDYNVRITKDGYQTLNTHRRLEPPWHDRFPFDFFAQVLWPGRIVDSYQWSFDLVTKEEPTRDKLIHRAEEVKRQVE